MKIKKILGIVAGTIIATSSANAGGTGFLLKLGLDRGGEKLGTVEFSDGSDDSLRAGEGVTLSAGLSLAGSDQPVDLHATIGYKKGKAGASNGDYEWSAKQADLLAFYRLNNVFRVGGGFTYHFDPTFEGNGDLPNFKARFDDALGYMTAFEANGGGWFMGLQYTWIEYDLVKLNNVSVSAFNIRANGDSFGLYMGKQWN